MRVLRWLLFVAILSSMSTGCSPQQVRSDAGRFDAGFDANLPVDTGVPDSAAFDAGTDLGVDMGVSAETRIVFVSESLWTGDLGMDEGADELCQDEADAAGLSEAMGYRHFHSWLGTMENVAPEHVRLIDANYVLRDGTLIASSASDLLDGSLRAPINRTASGALATGSRAVWTGTYENGSSTAGIDGTCLNWTTEASSPEGGSGDFTAVDGTWTFAVGISCGSPSHLYCFESGS